MTEAGIVDIAEGIVDKRYLLTEALAGKRSSGHVTAGASLENISDADIEDAVRYMIGHAALAGAYDGVEETIVTESIEGLGDIARVSGGDLAADAANPPEAEVGSLQLVSALPEAHAGRGVDSIADFTGQNYATMAITFARRINENGRTSDIALPGARGRVCGADRQARQSKRRALARTPAPLRPAACSALRSLSRRFTSLGPRLRET